MSLSSETHQQSVLTDEVLQEASDYEQQRYHRQHQHQHQHQQKHELEHELEHEHELELEHDNNEYSNVTAHTETVLIRAQHDQQHHLPQNNSNSNSNNNKSEKYYSSNDYSLAATSSQVGESSNQKLCWRSNPAESLSDWKLHIFNRSKRTFEIYHVHRVVLALGPRGCEYFQDIFRQVDRTLTAASANKTTRVPLIAESCKLVACFLDYIYGNKQFEITSENALGICYLADYFRNHSLWDIATDYIEEDLGTVTGREHLCQYYIDSVYYDQDEFLDHILAVCSRDLLSMIEENIPCSKLLGEITPDHFSQILVDMKQPTESSSSSIFLTRLITEYCCLHRKEMSLETFDHFTSRVMVLNSSSAISLLETSLEYDFGPYKDGDQNNISQDSVSSLILFQQQCIGTLSEEWEQLLELDQNRVTRIMRILSLREKHQNILVDWFQKTLIRASNQLLASRQETDRVEQQMLLLKDRYKVMVEELEVAQKETATSERNHNSTKSEMKTQISSWMRKNEGTNQQRQAEQQKWEHERLRWQMEHQKSKHEKAKLKRELKALRKKVSRSTTTATYSLDDDHRHHHHHRHHHGRDRDRGETTAEDRPYVIPNDYDTCIDDSKSYITDSSSDDNSLVDDLAAAAELGGGDPHMYPLRNGMSPQFRLF